MGTIAFAVVVLGAVLIAANFSYGLVHETAHALVVKALGGQVFGIYVNPFGLDAFTEHSQMAGPSFILIELAGLGATTIAAIFLTMIGKEAVPAFFALRTAIYALNYAPGTDISNVYYAFGNATWAISAAILAINLIALAYVLGRRYAPPTLTSLFSSLSREYPAHNSGE